MSDTETDATVARHPLHYERRAKLETYALAGAFGFVASALTAAGLPPAPLFIGAMLTVVGVRIYLLTKRVGEIS